MSQIAYALAKAKERTGHTMAPFGSPVQTNQPVALAKAKSSQRVWVVLLSFVIVFGGASLWYSGRTNASVGLGSSATPSKSIEATTEGPGPRQAQVNSDGSIQPMTELQDVVNSLVISAVIPGQQPRIMLQGRVVNVGQSIDESIVFTGVDADRLIFKDTYGAIYLRRY